MAISIHKIFLTNSVLHEETENSSSLIIMNHGQPIVCFISMKTRHAMTQWHMSAIVEADVEWLVIFYARERTIVQIINDD